MSDIPSPSALLMAKDVAQDCVIEHLLAALYRNAGPEQLAAMEDQLRAAARSRVRENSGTLPKAEAREIEALADDLLVALLRRVRTLIAKGSKHS